MAALSAVLPNLCITISPRKEKKKKTRILLSWCKQGKYVKSRRRMIRFSTMFVWKELLHYCQLQIPTETSSDVSGKETAKGQPVGSGKITNIWAYLCLKKKKSQKSPPLPNNAKKLNLYSEKKHCIPGNISFLGWMLHVLIWLKISEWQIKQMKNLGLFCSQTHLKKWITWEITKWPFLSVFDGY